MPISILIVDDEPKNLTVLETVLDDPTYRLVRASSAEEALLALLTDEFALLILDVRMPGTNGFELASLIKERKKTASIPIIFLTAYYNEDQHVLEGYSTGAVDYLHKPVNGSILRSKVSVFADLYRKSRELGAVNTALQVEVGERRRAEEDLKLLNNTLEQRVAERTEELIANQSHLRQAAQTARLTYLEIDFTHLEARSAENYLDVMGFQPSQTKLASRYDCSQLILDHVHPDDRLRLKSTFDLFTKGNAVGRVGYRVVGDDLVGRWIESHMSMHFGREGKPSRIFVTHLDVSATKLSQEALERSEQRLRMALDSAELGSWSITLKSGVLTADTRFLEISGMPSNPIHFEDILLPIHPDDRQHVRRELEAAMSVESPQPYEAEYRVILRDGSIRWVFAKGGANLSQTESVKSGISIDGVIADISRRKKAEEDLRRVNSDLEQFAFSASHDLQEPLRNVALYSELLKEHYQGKFDAEGELFLSFVNEGARRTSALIADLLAYTQALGVDQKTVESVDAEEVLSQVIENLAASLKESGGKITHESLPTVCIRPRHLEQILQNLIGNALKYRRDESAPHVHISAAEDTNFWQFSVRDNGIGISKEYQNQVFGLFKRLHSRGEKYSGTGIGLAICVKVIESYGGRIWLDSELGKGTTFYFTLPYGQNQGV